MRIPEPGQRKALQRRRTKSGYTAIRVTKVTRALLAKLEGKYGDEPLDALVFYMAAGDLGLDFMQLLTTLDTALQSRRLGCARAAR